MQQSLCSFWRGEDGQDLVEYSLLISFFALITAAFMGSGHEAIKVIWTTETSTLAVANSAS